MWLDLFQLFRVRCYSKVPKGPVSMFAAIGQREHSRLRFPFAHQRKDHEQAPEAADQLDHLGVARGEGAEWSAPRNAAPGRRHHRRSFPIPLWDDAHGDAHSTSSVLLGLSRTLGLLLVE